MKTIKLSYLLPLLVGITLFMNSCSSSQQFAGYYPENRITGKGIGQSVGQAKKVEAPEVATAAAAPATTVAEPTVAPIATVNALSDVTPVSVEVKRQSGSKMLNWANKVAAKNMEKLIAANNGTSHSMFGIREKIAKKIFGKIADKYGISATQMNSAASLESASRPLAITAFALGCASLLPYVGWFFGPAAIALGVVALIGIKRGGDGKKWMAICGIAFGAAGLFLSFIWYFVVFSAII